MTRKECLAIVEGMARGGDPLAMLICESLGEPALNDVVEWDEEAEPEPGDAP